MTKLRAMTPAELEAWLNTPLQSSGRLIRDATRADLLAERAYLEAKVELARLFAPLTAEERGEEPV